MKKSSLIAGCLAAIVLASCSNESTTTNSPDSTNANSTDSNNAATNTSVPAENNTMVDNNSSRLPLSKDDSAFVMKAATGGMTEIESAKVALANSQNDRIKAYANMMIADHGKANSELASIVGGRLNIPTTLPPDKQKHVDGMKNMKGSAFDKHYATMMVSDHKKTVADFEKASNTAADAGIKGFAAKTLPVIKMHTDSIQAIAKSKM